MTTAQLPDPQQLQNENAGLRNELVQRDQTILYLNEQLDCFKRQIFGKKSDRIVSNLDSSQMQFEGFEAEDLQSKEQTQPVPAHQRRKPNRNGQDAITLDPNLPVKITILDIPEEDKICKETGTPLVQIGFQPLVENRKPIAIPVEDLYVISLTVEENKECAGQELSRKHLLDDGA